MQARCALSSFASGVEVKVRSAGDTTSLPPAASVRCDVTPSPLMLADVVMFALKLTCR